LGSLIKWGNFLKKVQIFKKILYFLKKLEFCNDEQSKSTLSHSRRERAKGAIMRSNERRRCAAEILKTPFFAAQRMQIRGNEE
jgi:hypothetical protein